VPKNTSRARGKACGKRRPLHAARLDADTTAPAPPCHAKSRAICGHFTGRVRRVHSGCLRVDSESRKTQARPAAGSIAARPCRGRLLRMPFCFSRRILRALDSRSCSRTLQRPGQWPAPEQGEDSVTPSSRATTFLSSFRGERWPLSSAVGGITSNSRGQTQRAPAEHFTGAQPPTSGEAVG
jgi:hypothetical protein